MSKIVDQIKNHAFADYRSHVPGVICDIIDCNQYLGFHSVLKVSPVDYESSYVNIPQTVKRYNVVCCGAVGVYGFPTNIKEIFYAYVLTDSPSSIEGRLALIIPKTFLLSNPGQDYAIEPDAMTKAQLADLKMRKETLIRSRKFT